MDGRDAYESIMASLDAPMAIVTTRSGLELAGCLVGFQSQAGIEPPAIAVWLSKANHTFRVSVFAEMFALHFLEDDHFELAQLFGTVSGDEEDKFSRCDWHEGRDGVPLLDGCPHRVVGRKLGLLDTTENHACLVLSPVEATTAGPFTPLRRSQVAHLPSGHDAGDRP